MSAKFIENKLTEFDEKFGQDNIADMDWTTDDIREFIRGALEEYKNEVLAIITNKHFPTVLKEVKK